MKSVNVFRKSVAAFMMFAFSTAIFAHDFTATINGQKLFFNIKNKAGKTIEVTYNGSIAEKRQPSIEGSIEIPARIKHDDVVYTVASIGPKAFSGATKLTEVVMPSTIKSIDDFAFEGCKSLSKVVFPGNAVVFGQGVFFKCESIKDVTIGSDWTSIDLSMFRWSDKLETLYIPAKMRQIKNLKAVKTLKNINVDVNNGNFTSKDGILYNKDVTVLYGCPKAYGGNLKIAEGTITITSGSLSDCMEVTSIDIPSTVTTMSFREFARLKKLNSLIFRGETPVNTAYSGKTGKFVLLTANPELKIYVKDSSKKIFKASLVQQTSEFTETADGTMPYVVRVENMPNAKNIIGVKDFAKLNK